MDDSRMLRSTIIIVLDSLSLGLMIFLYLDDLGYIFMIIIIYTW